MARPRRSHIRTGSRHRQRIRLPRKSASMSASWRKSALRRVNIWRLRLRGKAATPPKFWPRLSPKKSLRSTGPRICTGDGAGKCSFVRCAGWWQCSMSRSSGWNCSASEPGINRGGEWEGLIRNGNERVLRARFNDARFFWQTDQKQTLRQRVELLRNVTFQKDLGSYYDKTLRVQRMASWLAETVKQNGMAGRPGGGHKASPLAETEPAS